MTPAERRLFLAGLRVALLHEQDRNGNPPIDCVPVGSPPSRIEVRRAERDLVAASRAYRDAEGLAAVVAAREAVGGS